MAIAPSKKPRRPNSLRLDGADYSQPGAYFFTIVTHNREQLFGEVKDQKMLCSPFGHIVWKVWKSLPSRYPQVELDEAIVMPDHFHVIIVIDEVGAIHESPLLNHRRMTLPLIVGYFKMNSAKKINELRKKAGKPVWQRGYYDRILRDDRDYDELVEYIYSNPNYWGIDKD